MKLVRTADSVPTETMDYSNQVLTVVSHIPLPTKRGRKALFPRLPFERMNNGDSVLVVGAKKASHIASIITRTRRAASPESLRIFTKPETLPGGVVGTRFWVLKS